MTTQPTQTTQVSKTATNPANDRGKVDRKERVRVPMSVPTRKLEVPDIEGFHLHWFLQSRVPRALQGGYEFVDEDEVPINQKGIGTDLNVSGNNDLGSQIRIIAGTGEDGDTEYLVLMKIKEEFWLEDRAVLDRKNAHTLGAIYREEEIIGPATIKDGAYIDKERSRQPLFQRPKRVSKT